jgi:pimeloyl-ACP methyl ester carboxylesterase
VDQPTVPNFVPKTAAAPRRRSQQPAIWRGRIAAGRPPRRRRLARVLRRGVTIAAGLAVILTIASFGYNLVTGGPAARPAGLQMVSAGGFDTRYRTWGTGGSPVVLVPGAFETADTFAALGAALGTDHRVFAIDLTGTGYSSPSPPFDASHLADQLLSFLAAERLTGADAPVLVGHSSGAAVVGMAALRDRHAAAGIVFLDGDATPLAVPALVGWLLIDPYRTTLVRLAVSSGWLIERIYQRQCGPACPHLSAAGVQTWRLPLQQPGFRSVITYTLRHGIPSMTGAELSQLRDDAVPKRVIVGLDDPQFPPAAADQAAARIGAPAPTAVPGRHLTMISSPQQVAAAIRAFIGSMAGGLPEPGKAAATLHTLVPRSSSPGRSPAPLRRGQQRLRLISVRQLIPAGPGISQAMSSSWLGREAGISSELKEAWREHRRDPGRGTQPDRHDRH